jgi:hypothetical protein
MPFVFNEIQKQSGLGTRIALKVWPAIKSQKYERKEKTNANRERQ